MNLPSRVGVLPSVWRVVTLDDGRQIDQTLLARDVIEALEVAVATPGTLRYEEDMPTVIGVYKITDICETYRKKFDIVPWSEPPPAVPETQPV